MDQGKNKIGLIIALVALVVVLAGGFVAYQVLSAQGDAASLQVEQAEGAATAEGALASGATEQGALDSAESQAPTASDAADNAAAAGDANEATPADDPGYGAPGTLLADHDAIVYDAQGNPMALTNISYGRPMVLNFWATWCPYCIQEMDDYQALYEEFGDKVAFAFIDQSDGTRETVETATAWLEDNGHAALPSYFDTNFDASLSYLAQYLPTTVVIDRDGTILTNSSGAIDYDQMHAMLEQLAS